MTAARWLVAGTPVDQPYPCRCSKVRECRPSMCPCAARPDVNGLPTWCCGPRYTPAQVIAARREYDARRRATHD